MSCAYTPPTVLVILRVEDPNALADTPPADGFGYLGAGHFEEAGEEVEKAEQDGYISEDPAPPGGFSSKFTVPTSVKGMVNWVDKYAERSDGSAGWESDCRKGGCYHKSVTRL